MPGFRRIAIHLALVALLLRAFVPAGWMPGAPGDAPLVMCGIAAFHDTADGREVPVKSDNGDECAFAAAPALPAPDMAGILAPVLQAYDLQDEPHASAPVSARPQLRPAPRAPPSFS